ARLGGNRVEAADRPRIVAAVDVRYQLHHLFIAGDAAGGELRVDRALDRGFAADGDKARLEERQRHAMSPAVIPVNLRQLFFFRIRFIRIGPLSLDAFTPLTRNRDEALALVFLDDAAVLTREGFELGRVEAAARHDQAVRVRGRR